MLKSLRVENFTVFPDATFTFGKNLNVIVGENGAGKSHVLKAAYAAIAVTATRSGNGSAELLGKEKLQTSLADKLQGVFRPDGLWRLVTRRKGNGRCRLTYIFDDPKLNLRFSFSRRGGTKTKIEEMPTARGEALPVFLPTRELLTISPGFTYLYKNAEVSFEETWFDTCIMLEAPLARGARDGRVRQLLVPLESAMGGGVEVDRSGHFFLKLATGKMEMHLVAEGLRKLATVARLIATGSLLDKGYLFWDEPESNLNPKAIKIIAKAILQIAQNGVQVFIATHSLFLMRELHILQKQEFERLDARCFGLQIGADGAVNLVQGPTMDDIGDISALNEDLQQSERYIDTEMGLRFATG